MSHEKDTLENISPFTEKEVTPKDLLRFAQYILLSIAAIFILSGISELIFPNNNLFELCKMSLPQIVTLIIGFYFGKTK